MNIDSVAAYVPTDGRPVLFATAKEGHVLRMFDGASGTHLGDVGGEGTESGRFRRPNGIVVVDDLLVVIERDNRRIQILNLPALQTLGIFGAGMLERPYGGYVQALGEDRYRLFVTDNYETVDEQVPPVADLGRRIHRFGVTVERDTRGEPVSVSAIHEGAFGATEGAGVLRVVESIWGDPDSDRLLIAEEDPAGGRVLKAYTLAGEFRNEVVGEGYFETQPEGIALVACDDGSGYWVTTDQAMGHNVFHLFDRRTLAHVGAFEGAVTRNTDGIWLETGTMPGFPAGAFFAVHDDQAVAAFDWRDVASALDLPPGC